jgi:hypothetical protein
VDAKTTRRFPIRLDPRFGWFLRIFGVRSSNAYVDLGEMLDARFGWSRITTPVSNCARWSIEGPWLALTALGVRRSVRGGDVTFGGSSHGGVRIDFRERPRYFFFRPPAIYVTVDDLEGFAAALAALGIPGEDKRRSTSGET